MLTKGVLLTHEHDVRQFTRREALRKLTRRVLQQAMARNQAPQDNEVDGPKQGTATPVNACREIQGTRGGKGTTESPGEADDLERTVTEKTVSIANTSREDPQVS